MQKLRPGTSVLYDCDLTPLLNAGLGAFDKIMFAFRVLYFPGPGTLFSFDKIIFLYGPNPMAFF